VQSNGIFSTGEPCKTCNGRGLVVEEPCPACAGSGRAKSNKTMQVRIPSGVSDSQRIRIKGKGGKGENGGAAGDLYVTVHVKPHAIFGRKAYDLTIEVPVTFAEATLGAEIEVPTLKGSPVRLKVPAGLQSGAVLRVKGKGVQKPNAEYGNLLVSIKVVVPEHVTPEAEESLKAFTQAVNQPNPRENLLETSPKRAQG
jgi:molecular chaperone DnaJ